MQHTNGFIALIEAVRPQVKELSVEEVAAMLLSSPSPLEGEGGVGGGASNSVGKPTLTTPHPNPPPQGGRGFILIDVREDNEWAAGHIAGAVHLGKGVIERDIEANVPDKNAPLVLYCGGGSRSVLAADNLQKMGYTNVASMASGWRGWVARGLPRT